MPIHDHIVSFGDAEDVLAQRNLRIASAASERLSREYPGYTWIVEVSAAAGIMNVRCPDLSEQFGYQLPLRILADEGAWTHWLRHAGGEFLERFSMPREGIRPGSSGLLDAKGQAWKH